MDKSKLISLGWTEGKLRERLMGCRKGIKELTNEKTKFTYRFLFIEMYLKYKGWLRILEN